MTVSARQSSVSGLIATPSGFVRGEVHWSGNKITEVVGTAFSATQIATASEPIIVPGFVDLHVHGAGGVDLMDGGSAADTLARKHAEHGTTALLATTLTATQADLLKAFSGLAAVMARQEVAVLENQASGARILGVHLEGPYISPDKLGAQPAFAREFNEAEFLSLHSIAPIKLATVAPELAHAANVVQRLVGLGVKVQLGHTNATYEQAVAAMQNGATGVTHLYNAMSGLHHRAPGLVGAALAHSEYAELIPDLLHVHPGALRVALRAITRCYCVTDSTAAAGMPDGEYRLGTHRVNKCMGGVRLADGTLAGSTLTMDLAFANLVQQLGLPILEAVKRCSTYACQFLGITDRGVIQAQAYADMVVLNADLSVAQVIVEGVVQPRIKQ
jgi:N-acetylglucosamine-6-phosphate deacetylase